MDRSTFTTTTYPTTNEIGNDLFVINNSDDDFLVYAPLRKILFRANGSAVGILQKYLNGDKSLANNKVIIDAKNYGLFTLLDQNTIFSLFNKQWEPLTAVTIALTYACNLNCIYCYANGGEQKGIIDDEIIKASIELAAENSKKAGYDFLRLGFHGTGEATLAWQKLKYAVSVAEEISAKLCLIPYISLTTNGTNFSKEIVDFLVKHNIHVSISLDGYKEIQDFQRPTRQNNGSYENILKGLKLLREENVYFSFRATVLPENMNKLCTIVKSLHDEVFIGKKGKIIFEPAEIIGRAIKSEITEFDPDIFIENYKKAFELGQKLNIKVTCSADLRFGLRQSFCDANGRIFLVLPTGEVSSCTRITTNKDSLASTFHYGYYDKLKKIFVFNKEKLNQLINTNVNSNERCQNCFCKWHCAGQCIAADYSEDGHWEKMCYLTRELSKWRLNQIVDFQV